MRTNLTRGPCPCPGPAGRRSPPTSAGFLTAALPSPRAAARPSCNVFSVKLPADLADLLLPDFWWLPHRVTLQRFGKQTSLTKLRQEQELKEGGALKDLQPRRHSLVVRPEQNPKLLFELW